jgi:hypothetical protein
MTYCGIDLASKTSAVCVLDARGKILRELDEPHRPHGVFAEPAGGRAAALCGGGGSLSGMGGAAPGGAGP